MYVSSVNPGSSHSLKIVKNITHQVRLLISTPLIYFGSSNGIVEIMTKYISKGQNIIFQTGK